MNRLEYYMFNLNIVELKNYLGHDLADLLIEWTPEGQQIDSQENLIKIILSIYGDKILDNKDFRNRILKAFEPDKIMDYRFLLPGYENEKNPAIVIEKVSNAPWGKNNISYKLLDDLEIEHDYFNANEDSRTAIESIDTDTKFYELLDYQFVIRQKVISYMNSDNEVTKMLVRMPTGSGKTKTAMHTIINQFVFKYQKKGLIVWVAHTKELLDQAYNTFCDVWKNIGSARIMTYKLWDKFEVQKNELRDGILFVGIQKLNLIRKNNSTLFDVIINKSNIIVVDEAHRAGANETRETIKELMLYSGKQKTLIGLTATPGRTESEENEIFKRMFDNKIIDIDINILNQMNLSKVQIDNIEPEKDIIKYFQGRGILSKLKRTVLEYGDLSTEEIEALRIHMTENGYKDVTEKFLRIIALNKKRNKTIVNKLIEISNQRLPAIVFACSVEHGKMLSAALTLQGIKNGNIFGNMNSNERRKIIDRFKDREDDLNILINYEVLTTGFDATNIRCVFITRPTNSVVLYSQMIGRGLRGPQMGGNEYCELIDIADNLEKYTNESQAFNYFSEYWD